MQRPFFRHVIVIVQYGYWHGFSYSGFSIQLFLHTVVVLFLAHMYVQRGVTISLAW